MLLCMKHGMCVAAGADSEDQVPPRSRKGLVFVATGSGTAIFGLQKFPGVLLYS